MSELQNDVSYGQFRREKKRVGPVPISTKIFQGLGALPGSHKDFAFNSLLLLFYNQILQVPATAASIVLAIALIFDAITDPLMGALSDGFRSRLGRRHPFMYAAAFPLGFLMYLLFTPPDGLSENMLIAWLLVITLLIRLAFTFFVVPWNALAAEYSDDYVERTSIVTYRYLVGWMGGVTFTFAIYTFVFAATKEYPVGQLNPENYEPFAIVVGSLITFWCLLTTHLTKREIPYLRQPMQKSVLRISTLLKQVWAAMQSPNLRLIFISFLMFSGLAGVGGVFDSFMNTFYWEFAAEELRWFVLTIIGAIAAFVTVPFLQRNYQKQHIVAVSVTIAMLVGILKVVLRFADVWPDNGDPMLLTMLIANSCVLVYSLTVAGIMFASMIADMVDEQELRTGMRQEGVFASVIGFSAKATTSIGLVIGGTLLDHVVGFPRGEAVGTIDSDTLFRLAFTDGVAVNIFFVIPIYILTRYTLTLESLTDVQDKLAIRRADET
jgi:GPH family glycoside/pentoside/hexuronide:cation symporter